MTGKIRSQDVREDLFSASLISDNQTGQTDTAFACPVFLFITQIKEESKNMRLFMQHYAERIAGIWRGSRSARRRFRSRVWANGAQTSSGAQRTQTAS